MSKRACPMCIFGNKRVGYSPVRPRAAEQVLSLHERINCPLCDSTCYVSEEVAGAWRLGGLGAAAIIDCSVGTRIKALVEIDNFRVDNWCTVCGNRRPIDPGYSHDCSPPKTYTDRADWTWSVQWYSTQWNDERLEVKKMLFGSSMGHPAGLVAFYKTIELLAEAQ